jgi:CRISPR/Cas system CSM-associated protein Csm3 (group 7 of RAMP superfamily)
MMSVHLNDYMGGRILKARWVIRGKLTLLSAMHLRGEENSRVDMAIIRDQNSGKPLLPGTTLAGALRDCLVNQLTGYFQRHEPPEVSALFGGARLSDGSQSALIVFDALGEFPTGQQVEIRDGVAISPRYGTAETHFKYDYEVLPKGTTFAVRLDLLVPEAETDEEHLLRLLTTALEGLETSSFGAKRSRGLGRVTGMWEAARFDLTSSQGWVAWSVSDHREPFRTKPTGSKISDAVAKLLPGKKTLEKMEDKRRQAVVNLDLKVEHDILVRSYGTDPAAPDVVHLKSGGTAILPGTSLAGVFRAQALKIANLVRADKNDAQQWIDNLFGPRFDRRLKQQQLSPTASRVRFSEAVIQGSRPSVQTRVAIDRFTQGVVETALFDEQTEVGGSFKAQIEIRESRPGELGLILLVLKDLLDGSLAVGGTSSVGRGVLKGTASVTWTAEHAVGPVKLEPGQSPTGPGNHEIDSEIRAFHEAPPLANKVMGVVQ